MYFKNKNILVFLMNKQTRYRLSKFLSILIGCILADSFLLNSCNVSNNDTSDTLQSLANTQWVLEYIQTKGEMMYPGDDYYSIQFIGEDSIATYTPDDTLSSRAICIFVLVITKYQCRTLYRFRGCVIL